VRTVAEFRLNRWALYMGWIVASLAEGWLTSFYDRFFSG